MWWWACLWPIETVDRSSPLIGFFVNTLVLRQPIQAKSLLEEVLGKVHRGVGQAQLHQALPFEQLVDLLEVERDPSRHPLFQVMFVMAQQSSSEGRGSLGASTEPLKLRDGLPSLI